MKYWVKPVLYALTGISGWLVYLNLKNWAEAEKWSAEVMKLEQQGVYELLSDYGAIHLEQNKNNKESILERQYSTEFSTNWRPVYFGPRGIPLARTNEAIPLLKRIRDRAGLETKVAYSQDEMRKAIRHERRTEFAFEDIRGWDIIRWGIQEEVMAKIPGSKWIKGKCELWPLPSFVLDENPNIRSNNPGW